MGCWRGYLSGARCRLAYSPADFTATHCLFSKIQIGFTFLVPAHPGSPGQRAVKRVCVCVCVNVEPWCIPTFTSKPLLLPVFGYRSAWISNCWTALLTVRKIASVILLMCALLSIVYNLWNQLNVMKAIKNKRYFVDETSDMHWTFFVVIIGFCAFLQSYFQQCIHLVFSLFQLRSLYCVNFFYCPYFTSMNCSLMINYDGCLIQLCLCIFDQGLLFSNL